MNNAKLEQINVGGVTFQYINYNDDEKHSSVAGLIAPITPESRKQILNVGGFWRDMLEPLRNDESIHRIVILSATEKGMKRIIGFFFDNNQPPFEVTWTKEPNVVQYYEKHLKDRDIPYENINTLSFLQAIEQDKEHNEKYFYLLDHYYNPVRPDDTGLHVGDDMIRYGQNITIKNLQSVVQQYDNLKNGVLGKLKVDTLKLKIHENGPHLFGTIADGTSYREDGRVVTNIEDYYYTHEDGNYKSFEEFLKHHEIETIHYCAYQANERINRRPHKKDDIIAECNREIDAELRENNEPYNQMIGLNLLLVCIKENLVSIN